MESKPKNPKTKAAKAERPQQPKKGQKAVVTQQKAPRVIPKAGRPQISPTELSDAQAAGPSTSHEPKGSMRVASVEEVDLMSSEEIHFARLSGSSKKRMKDLMKAGLDYTEAKRAVIKDKMIRFQGRQETASEPKKATQGPKKGERTGQQGQNKDQKRPRQEKETPPVSRLRKKKAKLEELSMSEALSAEKVAVVQEGFPGDTMEPDQLVAVQDSIMEAYERIPVDGPQVRFVKCTHRPGHLLVTCADAESATWLREIVPTLKPWEDASLKTLRGNEIPGLHACTVYIPDEHGKRLETDRVLTRLRVSNKSLNTNLWTVFGKTPAEKGQLWTFSMDKKSMDELKKLDMRPYFGMGRIKFRPKEQGPKPVEEAGEGSEAPVPLAEEQRPIGEEAREAAKDQRRESPPRRMTPRSKVG